MQQFPYVGSADIRERALDTPTGTPIESLDVLRQWLRGSTEDASADGSIVATFTVSPDGTLSVAARRSEHVACANGGPVLSAGEITFSPEADVVAVTNQSTGFCPDVTSWPAVSETLDRLGVSHPGSFTTEIVFRRCPECEERQIVRDGWFECALCGSALPLEWNC